MGDGRQGVGRRIGNLGRYTLPTAGLLSVALVAALFVPAPASATCLTSSEAKRLLSETSKQVTAPKAKKKKKRRRGGKSSGVGVPQPRVSTPAPETHTMARKVPPETDPAVSWIQGEKKERGGDATVGRHIPVLTSPQVAPV